MELRGKTSQSDIVRMEILSSEYGWTPAQIRKQNREDIEKYLEIIGVKRKLQQYGTKGLKHNTKA